jgi:hypothetical protein
MVSRDEQGTEATKKGGKHMEKVEQLINADGTPEEYIFRRRYRRVSGKWSNRYGAKFTD